MQANLSIKGITVQNIYSQYLVGYYLINRRYQRKLVWRIDEKSKFIDSILNGYPIPMILGANYKKADDSNSLEVLDGMQRLNAITSFIEGEFPISSKYFNLEAIAQTKVKKDAGELIQNEPTLSIEECAKILDYPVPFSIFDESEPAKLDESFRRINTGGRMLSKQDVRQAGALGIIPEIISEAAIYIRKDSSHSNFVDLRNMRNISLSNKGLDYGINLSDIFWAQHSIITQENIRMSRDEELVTHLITYMADPAGAQTTSHYLDEIYNIQSTNAMHLAKQINKIGRNVLVQQFSHVFDELKKTIESCDLLFKGLVFKGKPNKVAQVYQVIFIAFHKALIAKNLKVANYKNLCASLKNVFDTHLTALNSEQKWTAEERDALSNAILGVILVNFSPKVGVDRNLSGWVASLENILNESKTEQVCYDFKMGFCQITGEEQPFLPKIINKITKTLTAMTNTKPGECYVVVGVADKESDAISHNKHFGSQSVQYKGFFITGIDEEARKYHKNLSELEQKIVQFIEKEPIPDDFKAQIKANLVTFTYEGKEICLFKATRGSEPATYNGEFFTRSLSHNELVPSDKYFTFFKMFEKDSLLAHK